MHCWWKCELIQPLEGIVWTFNTQKKTKNNLLNK